MVWVGAEDEPAPPGGGVALGVEVLFVPLSLGGGAAGVVSGVDVVWPEVSGAVVVCVPFDEGAWVARPLGAAG
ncbi:MAG: hypothetical protein M3155_09390, partial [Actinomycetota bacterium]|nr:hypothetical protein [Actinomycetota bacterium]